VLPTIVHRYVATGQVLLGFSHLPVESIHPAAIRRATIAECAGRQGRFWEVHDRLFAGQTSASVEQDSADGLNKSALTACVSSGSVEIVRARVAKARALGIRSTPSLFVGNVEGERLRVTDAVEGLQRIKQLSELLERRLKR
jgi:protein-disulfide isomerase